MCVCVPILVSGTTNVVDRLKMQVKYNFDNSVDVWFLRFYKKILIVINTDSFMVTWKLRL